LEGRRALAARDVERLPEAALGLVSSLGVATDDQLALEPLDVGFHVTLAVALHRVARRAQLPLRVLDAAEMEVRVGREQPVGDLVRPGPRGAVAAEPRLQELRGLGAATERGERI